MGTPNMNTHQKIKQDQFYLASVDILQGISIFFVITWHTLLWRDHLIDSKWPNISLVVSSFMTIAMIIHPLFLYLYGFNVVNSLLRKNTEFERRDSRTRLLKRTILFFIIAEFAEGATGLVTQPEYLLNFLFTWELFHLFAFSTIFLLLIFEISWKLEEKGISRNYRKVSISILALFLIFILLIFLLIHDYTNSRMIETMYVDLTIDYILKRFIFEYGQNPLIPWLSFPILGGIVAIFLNMPNEAKAVAVKKTRLTLFSGIAPLILGIMFLRIERYLSAPVYYPASSSFVFISIGAIILSTALLILFIDLKTYSTHQIEIKILSPFIVISKITLTIFIVHNVAFIIPPET
ncbi:MAG: hypothetical protein JSV04_05050, partial [Candidatus Heimdallarchaeota archaeon]